MNIAFFGSPQIAADILGKIHRHFPLSLVVTQPDKPTGRKQIQTPTPVKKTAMSYSISIVDEISMPGIANALRERKINLAIVVAYGEIIPQKILEIPAYGFINIHYSLLPKYRGASPVQWSILRGDTETGVSIMELDEELDHGSIIATQTVTISENDTAQSLLTTLTKSAVPLLTDTLSKYKSGKNPESRAQNHANATYTRRLSKNDGFISHKTLRKAILGKKLATADLPILQREVLSQSANRPRMQTPFCVHNFIRALYPWPGAWTHLPDGKRCKLIRSELVGDRLAIREIQLAGNTKTADTSIIRSHHLL